MNERAMQTKNKGEKDRQALATRMREAVYNELTREDGRAEEEIFDGRGDMLPDDVREAWASGESDLDFERWVKKEEVT